MRYILEYSKFAYQKDDIVLIEYWYESEYTKNIITPVKIVERVNRMKYIISHDVENSLIRNAPNEIILAENIIDRVN